jgi:hypothetical protein
VCEMIRENNETLDPVERLYSHMLHFGPLTLLHQLNTATTWNIFEMSSFSP